MAVGFLSSTAPAAQAETRSLKFYHLHTREKAEIVYKRNGRYDQAGLQKINMILRDWRRNEPISMDPRLLDLVWDAYRATGSNEYIQVICGYRSSSTNTMLRSRSKGVAEKSQHMLGKALDFYIPGVPLKKLRDIGLKMQGGGVGYYPSSGSPFVHMDVGSVRHWPGISRQELVQVFPNGKTLHIPSDGKPLPGYDQALAAYKSRKGSSGSTGIALASAGGSSSGKSSGGLLAAFFGGGGADDEEDSSDVAAAPAPKAKATTTAVASAPAKSTLPGIAIVAPKDAKRVDIPQVADAAPAKPDTPETIIAALPARNIPVPGFAPRPPATVGAPETVPFGTADASAAPVQVASAAPATVPFGVADAAEVAAATSADPVQAAVSNVPLPSWRPEHASTAVAAAQPDQQAVLLALADTKPAAQTALDMVAGTASDRPDAIKAILETTSAAEPVKAVTDGYQVAALAKPRSVFTDAQVDPATLRKALAERPAGADAASVIGSGAKTTRKESRPTAQDLKPGAKPKVVAAQPEAARWALGTSQHIATLSDSTTAPQLAYAIVHSAPTEVYTAGFQLDQGSDPHRFSGTAVKFLSVAKFKPAK